MGINFPSSPLVGDLFPTPPLPGVPQYRWDGTIWATAPYTATDYVKRSGDSMTGALTLPGNAASALQAVPKQQLEAYAAPLDALSYSGMQINGSMEVSQERGVSNPLTNNGWICDGWMMSVSGAAITVQSQQGDIGTALAGFRNAIGVTVSVGGVPAAGDFYVLAHAIEGYRISRLGWGTPNARPITIGFYCAHFRTGTYSLVARGAATRSYATTYTQNVSGAWEYKTVTIPGDVTGAWVTNNTIGVSLLFAVACGSTYTAPSANNWVAGNFLAAPGQVNGVASTSDAFRLTGVVVLPGIYAPTAAQSPLIMRPYDAELLTCQRYWGCTNSTAPKGGGVGSISMMAPSTRALLGPVKFPAIMRGAPTTTIWHNGVQNQVRNSAVGNVVATPTPNILLPGNAYTGLIDVPSAPFIFGNGYDFDMQFDARL